MATNSKARRLAVVGCGTVVDRFYAPALQALDKAGWRMSFVDASRQRAADMARAYTDASSHDDIAQVAGEVGFAIVATPPDAHHPVCMALIEQGVNILCEKPLANDPAQGWEMVARAEAKGVRLEVNQTRRWFPASALAKDLIAQGAIGAVQFVRAREGLKFNWPARTAFHVQTGLQRNGIMSDQGSHVFDAVTWLLGAPLSPTAVSHDGYEGPEMTARIDFTAGDVRGLGTLTWLVDIPYRLDFRGTKGHLRVDSDWNRVVLTRDGNTEAIKAQPRLARYEDISFRVVNAFVDGSNDVCVATGRSAMATIEFLDACYRVGKPTLPLATAVGAWA